MGCADSRPNKPMDSTTVAGHSTPDPKRSNPDRPAEDHPSDLCCRSACPVCVLDEPITTCESKQQREYIISNDDSSDDVPALLAMLEAFERAQKLVDQLRTDVRPQER
ncbi:MAG: hypothetical protein KIT57_02460 [Blastocatellales bacterium]|nr:hypothetical protein [Blastocatellales bacterium]